MVRYISYGWWWVDLAGEGSHTRRIRAVVPKDVVLVRIDPSVLVIPERAFLGRKKLKASSFMMNYDDDVKLNIAHSINVQP